MDAAIPSQRTLRIVRADLICRRSFFDVIDHENPRYRFFSGDDPQPKLRLYSLENCGPGRAIRRRQRSPSRLAMISIASARMTSGTFLVIVWGRVPGPCQEDVILAVQSGLVIHRLRDLVGNHESEFSHRLMVAAISRIAAKVDQSGMRRRSAMLISAA